MCMENDDLNDLNDLNVKRTIVPEDEQGNLLGVTITSKRFAVNQKTSALSRLRCYISEKKAKLLPNYGRDVNFQYCPLI